MTEHRTAGADLRFRPATRRQRELFDELLRSFLREGFDGFTIDAAARRFHCSKSTLYALGATSDEVVRRVLVSFFREVARRTDLALDHPTSAVAALDSYFAAMAAALEPAGELFLRDLSTHRVGREVYRVNTSTAATKITRTVQQGVERGEFRAVNVALVGELVTACLQHIQQGEIHAAGPVDAYAELGRLALRGLAVRDDDLADPRN